VAQPDTGVGFSVSREPTNSGKRGEPRSTRRTSTVGCNGIPNRETSSGATKSNQSNRSPDGGAKETARGDVPDRADAASVVDGSFDAVVYGGDCERSLDDDTAQASAAQEKDRASIVGPIPARGGATPRAATAAALRRGPRARGKGWG
jgi:hypothetical protein